MEPIIGREFEKERLRKALQFKTAGLVAVYGRRRVGKTFLIHTFFKDQMVFELTGMYNATMKEQLQQFSIALQQATGSALPLQAPGSWISAFTALQQYLAGIKTSGKAVVFLDEFPWLDGRRSGFLPAFEHFWNTWAARQPHLLVVVCGSAASWMIRKMINNKGGLHNRITHKIELLPFTLAETESFLQSRGSRLDRYQIMQIYMALGGIPPYLDTVGKGTSAMQTIENTCFSRGGLLTGEFDNLYNSLFERADNHIKVVRALANRQKGLTRQELIKACRLRSGGTTTLMLEELERSGFIKSTLSYDKAENDSLYRLIDEFSIFYLKFIDKNKMTGKDVWSRMSATPAYASWCGMAFETACLKHVEQIKEGLRIKAGAEESTWRYVPSKGSKDKGAQIDLVLDRNDRIINLCEMKFYTNEFAIDKAYASQLRQKMEVFKKKVAPKKTLFLTMITTFGVKENMYFEDLVQQSITLDTLFRP